MALIERIEFAPAHSATDSEEISEMAGLRIASFGNGSRPIFPSAVSARCTTSSFSDYEEWSPEADALYRRGLITDGACS